MYPPDGLLTFGGSKHDVELNPRITTPDPLLSNEYLDESPPVDLCQVTTTAELNMNTGEDEPSPGLNGRLRPRKLQVPSPQGKNKNKSEIKSSPDKAKRTGTPSKASPNKQDDLANKADFFPTPQFLCPFCDKKFASKQTVFKHVHRIHLSTVKQDTLINCLFCNHTVADSSIIRHMVDSHPNQYFACLDCHTRFSSTTELAEHKLNVCEKQKFTYRTKLQQKIVRATKKPKKSLNIIRKTNFPKPSKDFQDGHGFNGIVISCELKPPQDHDGADIEDNITTNLILPSSKSLCCNTALEKNAVIVLDDVQWNKRIPPNFSFHNTDPDQILSRLGVVHRSPRAGESTKKDWLKALDDGTQKFERCFDTKFYSKVASNVQENLTKFLDGSFNFNPDPDNTIKTRKSKNNVVINTAEGFPILLASEQYSRGVIDRYYMPRGIAPKHKWKWDNLENDRNLMTAAEILKRDSHTNNCIITLVSSLDIWTQLSMRGKFEDKLKIQPIEKKTEKQNVISKELKEILESREIPTSSHIVKRCASKSSPRTSELEFPLSLGLVPAAPTFEVQPAVLSGEWVRPRCLVCCACGEHTSDSKGVSMHISTRHPNANIQFYEIVGEPLLNADILKHLYVPPSQVSNRTRPPRGFRECTKCNISVTLDDLHQHMLDCAGDTPAVRRRQPRQRPFGVRRRRTRMPDNTIRKKMRKDIRSRQRRDKTHIRSRPRIRTEVGDAETIRKMLADLPAKRHRVLVNPLNMMQRPRRKLDIQRRKLIMKKCSAEEVKSRKRNVKRDISDQKETSVNTNDTNMNVSSSTDNEHNKPLKSKMPSLRRRESLKRQAVITTVKRNTKRPLRPVKSKVENCIVKRNIDSVALKRDTDNADKVVDDMSADIEEISLDKSTQRLDLRKSSYKTREHAANRGASGSRDGQRPSCSGASGAPNDNSLAPAQSVPLKHSIARLTANSETHDKSVQFHHSFLVQQECNNTEHVPSGQRTLFENEAVVSKLDKPPLNYCQKGFLEIQNPFKNRNNKPRKGLNDCIAMLKNKLDPVPCQITGYVSVQCGTDEPIDAEPRLVKKQTNENESTTNVDFNLERKQTQENVVAIYQDKVRQIEQTPENLQILEQNANVIPQYIPDVVHNTESSEPQSKLSMSSYRHDPNHKMKQNPENLQNQGKHNLIHHELDPTQKLDQNPQTSQLQGTVDFIPHGQQCVQSNYPSAGGSALQENMNLQQYRQETLQENNNTLLPEADNSQRFNQNQDDVHLKEKTILSSHFSYDSQTLKQNLERLDFEEKNITECMQAATDKIKKNSEVLHLHNNFKLLTEYRHDPVNRSRSKKVQTKPSQDRKSPDFAPTQCNEMSSKSRTRHDSSHSQTAKIAKAFGKRQSTELYIEDDASKKDSFEFKTNWQNHLDALPSKSSVTLPSHKHTIPYSENLIPQNKSEISLDNELNISQTVDIFAESRVGDIPTNIPPAHASTIVESIISAPLDLSSKVVNANYMSDTESYDHYGTLDLSNKKSNKCTTQDISIEDDIIVDLSVKPPQPQSPPTTLDLCVKTGTSKGGDLSNMDIIDGYPTDLSVKGNGSATIQEMSAYKATPVDTALIKPQNETKYPYDFPEKHNNTIKPNQKADECNTIFIDCTPGTPNDLSRLSESPGTKQGVDEKSTPKNNKSFISEHTEVLETNVSNLSGGSQSQILNISSVQLQKHVYDPTSVITPYSICTTDPGAETATSKYSPPKQGLIHPTYLNTSTANVSVAATQVSQDLTNLKSSVCLSDGSQVYKTPSISSSITSAIGAVTINPIPGHSFIPVSLSKIESTTPVYTLAKACIAVTKIESSNASVLTNTLLSIPGSTIASTAPVYTLTGTTIGVPSQFTSDFANRSPSQIYQPNAHLKHSNNALIGVDINRGDVTNSHEKDAGIKNSLVVDQDPETAKKIAMLPKELVDILGNMPVDHRNRLLNVLPQYVSTTSSTNTNKVIVDTPLKKINQSPDKCPSKPRDETIEELDPITKSSSDSSHAVSADILPAPEVSLKYLGDETKKIERNTTEQLKAKINDLNYVCESKFAGIEDQLIDLTRDDKSPPIPKLINVSRAVTISSQENSACERPEMPSKHKTSNDKTASLRAVRIKAPSERQKGNVPLKTASVENVPDLKARNSDATETNKNSCKAIQQAEISSTQHNKTKATDSKETADIISFDAAKDDRDKPCKLSSLASEIAKETDKVSAQNKSTTVTSSILLESNCDASTTDINQVKTNNLESTTCLATLAINADSKTTQVNDASKQSIPVEQTCNKDLKHNASLHTNISSVTHEDESDDDIILAAIVKQKQLITDVKGKRNLKKKKKVTRSRKSTAIEKKLKKDNVAEKFSTNVSKIMGSKSNVKIASCSEYGDAEETSKDVTLDVNLKTDNLNHVADLKLVNDIIKQNGVGKELNTEKIDVDECVHKIAEHSEENSQKLETQGKNEAIFTQTEMCSDKNVICKIVFLKAKPIWKTKSAEVNIDNTIERIQCNDQPQSENENIDNATPQEIQITKQLDERCCETELEDCDKQDTLELNTEDKNDPEISSITEIQHLKSNNNIPLRRSRRGKSLLTESNFPVQDNFNTDNTDHKAPLTKKQLIFSKLLLDEEKHTKSLSFTAEKDIWRVTNKTADAHTVADEIIFKMSNDDISEASTEICKSVKRKQSPQLKRRSKKRKSVDIPKSNSNIDIGIKIPSKKIVSASEDIGKLGVTDCSQSKDQTENYSISDPYSSNTKGSESITNLEKPDDDKNPDEITKTTEKRKMSKVTSTVGSDQSLKSKKTKFDKVSISYDEQKTNTSQAKMEVTEPFKLENTVTTCYDIPIAARRTRSKSVVVKSSTAVLYDPYNIDLDDMIQKPEPLRKKGLTAKITTKSKNCSKSAECKISATTEPKTECKKSINGKNDVINAPPMYEKEMKSYECHQLKPISDKDRSVNCEQPAYIDGNVRTKLSEYMKIDMKDPISDSDDSSKSDVPLKKYVKAKAKKIIENRCPVQVDNTELGRNNQKLEKHISSGKKKTNASSKEVVTVGSSDEIEEQMRSEQFMESFGFFSERKPRKSNLLASKKISETFHIIANESEDLYYASKERSVRRSSQTDTKKSADGNNQSSPKKSGKRGRKKKDSNKTDLRFCKVCQKEFHRPDNYLRHQLTILHAARMAEVELKLNTISVPEEPNYLIAFKQQMDRLKILTDKAAKQKKNAKNKIVLPTLDEILTEVFKTVREQQLSRRGLSCDEALFIDCCELLKKSYRPGEVRVPVTNNIECAPQSSSVAHLDFMTNSAIRSDSISDGDVDSITAKAILESEEVRNLENDLISGLKEAANAKKTVNLESDLVTGLKEKVNTNANKLIKNMNYHATPCTMTVNPHEVLSKDDRILTDQIKEHDEKFGTAVSLSETGSNKSKRNPEYKEKMYPDVIEDIDMYEDKFDKIKRKCRSQAAAAKQVKSVTEPSLGYQGRKKTEKKKGKRSSKTFYQNTVLTKGALKGFDGIKVSIPTTEINMSGIVPLHENSQKKKRKTGSKKKTEKKCSDISNNKYDSDHRIKDNYPQKKVDVYEFMDNEDAELFEFRPSTLMERFKSINKESPSTSKRDAQTDELDMSSESASDGDDFVYMSDGYPGSEDETENSLLSDLGNVKNDPKKSTPLKKKDVAEKTAVMGKIFKHNAVRTEKKIVKTKESVKPKANLDQLFDSLLEGEPNSSVVHEADPSTQKYIDSSKQSPKYEHSSDNDDMTLGRKTRKNSISSCKPNITKSNCSEKIELEPDSSSSKYNMSKRFKYGPSTSKQEIDIYAPSTSGSYNMSKLKNCDETYETESDSSQSKKHESTSLKKHKSSPKSRKSPLLVGDILSESKEKKIREKSPLDKLLLESVYCAEFDEDTGVARHRARRKCTVGKQNVLAESWSSESEPDGLPPRPTSAETVIAAVGRKKKCRKRDGTQALGRRVKVNFNKKQDSESRVNSNKWSTPDSGATSSRTTTEASEKEKSEAASKAANDRAACPPPAPPPAPGCSTGSNPRPRITAYYWSSEGDEEHEHQQQQHGWIVGNSHKRLVTMLAHAKGRNRNTDDKRHLVE